MSDQDQFDRVHAGIDISGRDVKMTRRAKLMFDIACEHAKVHPSIIQGSFMGEDAAKASSHTHDKAGCIDTRTFDLTDDEIRRLIRAGRSIAAVSWKRVPPTFAEHMHWLFLGDSPMHAETEAQVTQYKNGLDGLGGPDPFFRPDPLVTTFNYDAMLAQEGEMNLNDKLFPDREDSPTVRESLVAANAAERKVTKVLDRLADFRKANAERDAGLAAQLDRIADAVQDDATKEQVRRVIAELRQQDRDVTQPEPV